jgi:hypothetical protein
VWAVAAQRFETVLERRGQSAVAVVPFDVRAAYLLSYTRRREHVEAITEAKRDGTRRRRVEGALEALRKRA